MQKAMEVAQSHPIAKAARDMIVLPSQRPLAAAPTRLRQFQQHWATGFSKAFGRWSIYENTEFCPTKQ